MASTGRNMFDYIPFSKFHTHTHTTGMTHFLDKYSYELEGVTEGRVEHTGLFEMIVGVITTCHTQYT